MPDDVRLFQAALRADLPSFTARCFATVEQGTRYHEEWHILHIARWLHKVRQGEERRLVINLPPRSLKSFCVSVAFTAWMLGHDPGKKILCVSYGADLARDHAEMFRAIVESSWYRSLFPRFHALGKGRLMDYKTTFHGYRRAVSLGGPILGRGADLIIIDDPNKAQEIFSKTARDKVKVAYDQTLSTRLNDPRSGAIVIVMQRLHEDDLTGHVLTRDDWAHVSIPAIAEADEEWPLDAERIYRRTAGDFLMPGRMTMAEYDRLRRTLGPTGFSAQYQQSPVPADGAVIKRAWLRYYTARPERFAHIIVSWDTASTLSEDANWSVGTVWGKAEESYYLLEVHRGRYVAPDLRRMIEQTHQRWRADATVIEDADLGRALSQDLRRSSSVRPFLSRPRYDKRARMEARAVLFETGRVLLPENTSWLAAYVQELLGFPFAKHDDQVDSTSQALDWMEKRYAVRPEDRPAGTPRRRLSSPNAPRRLRTSLLDEW